MALLNKMNSSRLIQAAATAVLLSLGSDYGFAEQPKTPTAGSTTAAEMADFFSEVGDQIYEDCIFELSEEQVEVQQALVEAYMKLGAASSVARRLAAQQIEPPKLSEKCEQVRSQARPSPSTWTATIAVAKTPAIKQASPKMQLEAFPSAAPFADKKVLPQWDCDPGVHYVTIQHKGYERKLTGGEICNPFDDVVHTVPESLNGFRLGYTIRTGRLFVIANNPQASGRTIAWAISGREACRNNPDPDCLAARAIGPLPPGEYSFAPAKNSRVSWGPRSNRMVAGIYLTKLWNRDKFTRAQTAAILARRNIAVHVRLKGEMSEACLGLGPKGWAHIASLIQQGRATGLNVYIEEPYPQMAEVAPIVRASTFSLSSVFK